MKEVLIEASFNDEGAKRLAAQLDKVIIHRVETIIGAGGSAATVRGDEILCLLRNQLVDVYAKHYQPMLIVRDVR